MDRQALLERFEQDGYVLLEDVLGPGHGPPTVVS